MIEEIRKRKEKLDKVVFWDERHKIAYQRDIETLLNELELRPESRTVATLPDDDLSNWENEGGA